VSLARQIGDWGCRFALAIDGRFAEMIDAVD
jgi:hypothetical protein